ncbi:polyhydroxyalkanoate synthesis repressor PhaR [Nisaea acidiphila]|uniref:Polyhydroxyalkanoate synthesis repressor PhaR n=1 Tax=Nisaea acidiphila TaxID=1862145 RepID=A0A9J7AKD0_9PROT|nr:polyhydroxyalkanoate synthesis repressor PhaR [Nisaea acidiphila]UUX48123.1 polyhydroxyalkanoate synthesis repressor PhaR [Nisaea acidiphila]
MATQRKRAAHNTPDTGAQGSAQDASGVITIKKYANRRLYNTATSSYVTLDHLCQMVKDGQDFVVYDAKTGEDITRPVLTQIIVEEEAKGQNMLPISFLRQLISFYGDNLQMVVPRYLEFAMAAFSKEQDRTRDYMQEALGGLFPFSHFEEMGKQNMAMLEQTMRLFNPYRPQDAEGTGAPESSSAKSPADVAKGATDALQNLQEQVVQLQQQLSALSSATANQKKDGGK